MTIAELLVQKLPTRHAPYAAAYANAAALNPTSLLHPIEFAIIHAALVDRESFTKDGHWALRPPGPSGIGDQGNRWYNDDAIPEAVEPLIEVLFTGRSRKDKHGKTQLEVRPPKWADAPFPGWGYGLGQIDFAASRKYEGYTNKEWLEKNAWQDPKVNLLRSAVILLDAIVHFNDVRCGIAGYNTRFDLVAKSDPDRFTTGHDYSEDVLNRAAKFGFTRKLV